jgi:hypothetical protein
MISQISKPRSRDYGLKTGKWKRNTGLKIATWNVTSLFKLVSNQKKKKDEFYDKLTKMYDIQYGKIQ